MDRWGKNAMVFKVSDLLKVLEFDLKQGLSKFGGSLVINVDKGMAQGSRLTPGGCCLVVFRETEWERLFVDEQFHVIAQCICLQVDG